MKRYSLWLENMNFAKEKKLRGNKTVDVLIIGGGITGISTAYFLKDKGLRVLVAERNQLMHGVTSKTTGKINYLQGIVYSKIEGMYSFSTARKYLESQQEAIKLLSSIIQEEHIDCNFEKVTSSVITTNQVEKLTQEYEFLKRCNVKATFDHKVNGAELKVFDTYVFHPLKYLQQLVSVCKRSGVEFYEGTNIVNLIKEGNGYVAGTENGFSIKATHVVLACHYPYFLLPYLFPLKTYLEKSYVAANQVKINPHTTFITTTPNIISERFLEDEKIYQITLMGSHRIRKSWDIFSNFEYLARNKPDFLWSNEDVMTFDMMPLSGVLQPQMYLATGYNTWGMTNGTLSALIISDLILKQKNSYASLFSLQRKNFGAKILPYLENTFDNTYSFIRSKLYHHDFSNIEFLKIVGKEVAVYHDGKKTYTVLRRCPHMGCALLFNPIEKTWECPCHASKFDITGKCIKGPSKYSITFQGD